MIDGTNTERISHTIMLLDAWLQTMRSCDGYSGPVAHWWQSCLLYSGSMIDWRYEGILCGYVQLYCSTGDRCWLERAIQAGDDVCRAQLPSGQFRNSSFEVGPIEGGTPHEAAADIGLLQLARALRSLGDERWSHYYATAERNLREYHLGMLWNGQAFRDQAWNETLVPNKNATTLEALLLYEALSGMSMEEHIVGTAELILRAQVTDPNLPTHGATIHLGTGPHRLAIGIYTARCAAALVHLYERYPCQRYLQAAGAMGKFLLRLINERGTVFGYYPDGQPIQCPTWISPSGDVLRALLALKPHFDIPAEAIDRLAGTLIEHQLPSGGIPTARGLGMKGRTQSPSDEPDFRDVLPVVGWVDKSFRALTLLDTNSGCDYGTTPGPADTVTECIWKGRSCIYRETTTIIELKETKSQDMIYRWRKGNTYPDVYRL